jgi:drug/metabolite transporter (DMT)-like permease
MSPARANMLLMFAAFCWGSGNVAQKTILDDLGPVTAIGLRCLLAALVILPFCEWKQAERPKAPPPPRWMLSAVLLFFMLSVLSMQIGYGGTSVTNAGFLVNTTTVMTPVFAWLLYRETPPVLLVPAIALTLGGIVLLGGGEWTTLNWGDMFCLAAAVFFAIWIVLLGRYVTRTGRPMRVSMLQFASTGAVCTAIGLSIETIGAGAMMRALPELLYLAIISTLVPYAIQAKAQQFTSASVAAVIMSAEALFGALGGAILLGERLSAMGALGCLLIIAGIIVIQFDIAWAIDRMRYQLRGGTRRVSRHQPASTAIRYRTISRRPAFAAGPSREFPGRPSPRNRD